jgi:hypothetical protein
MKKSNMKWICTVIVATSFSGNLCADEYIKLFATVPEGKFILLDKKRSEYDESRPANSIHADINTDLMKLAEPLKIKDEVIYELEDGEAIELSRPIFGVNGSGPEEPDVYPNTSEGWTTWSNAGSPGIRSQRRDLHVKFPESELWHKVYYQDSPGQTGDGWNGFGTNNPIIIGPCKVRLSIEPTVNKYFTSYVPQSDRRYGVYSFGNTTWLFMKKITLGGAGKGSTGQSLVLPEGSGDLDIVMEGSNDLIHWSREELGKKTTTNRKRFYRLRAVKE